MPGSFRRGSRMPRGGKRVGAGRPRKSAKAQWLAGNPGKRPLALVTSSSEPAPAAEGPESASPPGWQMAPKVLRAGERRWWELWAPIAIGLGTLTEGTVAGFIELCQVAHQKTVMLKQIERDGRTFLKVTVDGSGQEHEEVKAHPLMTHWR